MAKDKKIPANLVFTKEKFKYDTIQDVIDDVGLQPNNVVETNGYHNIGDGLGAKYLIAPIDNGDNIQLTNGYYAHEIPNSNGSKKVDKANTIEELKSMSLKVGDVIEVLGYYEAGDGAGHKRVIASEDDGSGVKLSNGLFANIIHNGEVNVSWFGAKGDGVTDDTEAIQKAIKPWRKIIFGTGIFLCKKTVSLKANTVMGTNKYQTILLFDHDGTGIILADRNIIKNICLRYSKRSNYSNCKAIEGYDSSVHTGFKNYYIPHFCYIENVVIENAGYGIYSNGYFSNVIKNLEVKNYHLIGIYIFGNTKTQNTYENIYISSGNNPTNAFVLSGEETGSTIIGLNIEHTSTTDDTMRLKGYQGFINGLHFEGITLLNDLTSLLKISNCNIEFSNIDLYYCFFTTDTTKIYTYIFIELEDTAETEKATTLSNIVINNLNTVGINYRYQLNKLLGLTDPNLSFYFIGTFSRSVPFGSKVAVKNHRFVTWINDYETIKYFRCDAHVKLIKRLEFKPRFTDVKFNGKWGSGNNSLRIWHNLSLEDEPPFAYINQIIDKFNTSVTKLADIPTGISGFSTAIIPRDDYAVKFNVRNAYNHIQIKPEGTYSNDTGEVVQNWERVYINLNWVFNRKIKKDITKFLDLNYKAFLEQEGVYDDYISYMDEKTAYDKQQRKLEQDRQLAYEQALKENPNLTYEEFMSVQPMMLNLVEEPQPSQALKDFMEKYL